MRGVQYKAWQILSKSTLFASQNFEASTQSARHKEKISKDSEITSRQTTADYVRTEINTYEGRICIPDIAIYANLSK